MKIVEQSHAFLHYPDPLELLEAAGRNCYKSEGKITEDSAPKFVSKITNIHKHYSVLGHAHICFEIDKESMAWLKDTQICTKYLRITNMDRILVSGNFWAWKEFFQRTTGLELANDLQRISNYLTRSFPEVFKFYINGFLSLDPIPEHQMTIKEKMVHAVRTCRLITNRAIQQELTRHRPWDYSIESTRYVDYTGDINFIKPVWFDDASWLQKVIWKGLMKTSELGYRFLRKLGWKAEQARGVLPLDLCGEIIATAPISEWLHVLSKRTAKDAHPQIRALMNPMWIEIKGAIDAR